MPVRVNPARLRSERLNRRWSQDQLSAISGVSVRTIQRLEQGRAATPTSLAALAIALSLPEEMFVMSDRLVRRVTPLTIVEEIDDARVFYEALGLDVIETGDPGCVGVRAGNSHLILCSIGFLRSQYVAADLAPLIGRTITYLWVSSLETAVTLYGHVIEEIVTPHGTREVLVERGGQWAILAETVR